MLVTRFYTTADDGSAFDQVELSIDSVSQDGWGNRLGTSDAWDSKDVRLFEVEDGAYQSWHNAPRRQLCVMLEGVWEVGTTDGELRRWGAGELFLPDDVTGKGHTSRVIEGPVKILFVPLPDDFVENLKRS